MSRFFLSLLISFTLLNLVSRPALADGAVFPEDLALNYLAVNFHHVTVTINGTQAITHVEQEFSNPFNVDAQGQYLFPIYPGAELTRFRVILDKVEQAVIRQDAATTNSILYSAITGRRDPSLLQYADWETFAFDLTVPAGGSRRMVVEYEEVLPPSGGLYRYHYVLSTERYSSRPLADVSLTVDVSLPTGLASLYSPSHPVTIERLDANRAKVSWQAQNVQPVDDFDLFFAPTDTGFGGGLLTGERNGEGHFMFLFSPQAQLSQADYLAKDVVFVIDRSGSMSGGKIEQARNALRYFLAQLNEADRFSIVAFDDRALPLSAQLLAPTAKVLGDAQRYVDSLNADGSTDIESALRSGLEIIERSGYRESASRLVVFLTDGLPTAGVVDEAAIAASVARINLRLAARLHVFGVGYDVNTHLLDQLAAENGGSVTYVQPDENLESVLKTFYDQIAHPVLTDLKIQFEGIEASDVYPQSLPDLFEGASLILTGRYGSTASTVAVLLTGKSGTELREYVYHFDLSQTGDYDFVPRLWATRRVGALLDQVRVQGETSELVTEVRELGLGYGVVTPYTNFVIAAQLNGAASASNMALYQDMLALNQSSGQITIQARVQNQAYQQADQANVAAGANLYNQNHHSLAQLLDAEAKALSIDLSLFQGQNYSAGEPITAEWIEQHVGIDREVEFGSADYFKLAAQPELRALLQSGPNVIFAYQGEVIRIHSDSAGPQVYPLPQQVNQGQTVGQAVAPNSVAPVLQQNAQPVEKPWWETAPWWLFAVAAAFLVGLWLAHLPWLAKLGKKR